MTTEMHALTYLANKELKGFMIRHYTEVYRAEVPGADGHIALFEDQALAEGYADTGGRGCKTRQVLVLTDGKVAYYFRSPEPTKISAPDPAREEVRKHALGKLTLKERKVLNL